MARARAVMPGGVSSPVRAFGAVGGEPRFIRSASGAHLVDVEGRRLIDLIGSWGALIAGHAHPQVVEAIVQAAAASPSFGTCCAAEADLAEEVIRRVRSIERVRFTNSGTEAVMTAIRLARGATGRSLVVKFDGGYHGHSDALLVRVGSGPATLRLPDSAGVPEAAVASTLSLAYNDLAGVEALFEEQGSSIAAVLLEPIAGNMGLVPPAPGFLEGLRRVTAAHGALLIFDEVMTGFRVGPGGAQGLFGIEPDLTTLGKILGGGLPVGAVGGRAGILDLLAPVGPVYQAGTMSGNPLTMAAGLATLRLLDETAYARLEASGARLQAGLDSLLRGRNACTQRRGSMLSLFFGVPHVRNFSDAQRADHLAYAHFFERLLASGVHLPPSGYESWFLSLAHDDASIDAILAAAGEALAGDAGV